MRTAIILATISLIAISAVHAEPREDAKEPPIVSLKVRVVQDTVIAPEMFDPHPMMPQKPVASTFAAMPGVTVR